MNRHRRATPAVAVATATLVAFACGGDDTDTGAPLLLLPLLAAPVQHRATRFLTSHHRAIGAYPGCC